MINNQAASSIDEKALLRIPGLVEEALPSDIKDVNGFHVRPDDPVEVFVFVGTRYAYRTTRDMVDALRRIGDDDMKILDFPMAVAYANIWTIFHRMLGLDAGLALTISL